MPHQTRCHGLSGVHASRISLPRSGSCAKSSATNRDSPKAGPAFDDGAPCTRRAHTSGTGATRTRPALPGAAGADPSNCKARRRTRLSGTIEVGRVVRAHRDEGFVSGGRQGVGQRPPCCRLDVVESQAECRVVAIVPGVGILTTSSLKSAAAKARTRWKRNRELGPRWSPRFWHPFLRGIEQEQHRELDADLTYQPVQFPAASQGRDVLGSVSTPRDPGRRDRRPESLACTWSSAIRWLSTVRAIRPDCRSRNLAPHWSRPNCR